MSAYGHDVNGARRYRSTLSPEAEWTLEPAMLCERPNRVGMAHTFCMASLFSAFHCSDCAARSVFSLAVCSLAVWALSSTCERLKPPVGVNSSGMTVDALGQSAPQPAHMMSPALSGSKTIE